MPFLPFVVPGLSAYTCGMISFCLLLLAQTSLGCEEKRIATIPFLPLRAPGSH